MTWGYSSAGRAPALQAGGQEFDPPYLHCPVVMRPREAPVPIPNTTVKTWTADNTLLETAREDRWLPDLLFLKNTYIL